MKISPVTSVADPDWLSLRRSLWPDTADPEHLTEMASFLVEPSRFAQFIARSASQQALGLAEVSLRSDYVNGTETSPVAFLEGLFVVPDARRQGVARALLAEVVHWARGNGCTELASDTQLENVLSQAVHARLGFTETQRVVHFNMALREENAA